MALTPGTRIGVYEITAPIGEGGMGQVYRAHDTKLNRDVALKVLPESFAKDADRLTRFTREAQTLASLNHPHIAAIYGLEESGGVRALVMELVEGEDLSQRIARRAIAIDEALPIAKQIAEALEAAHGQGIIHRDLKPANIKIRADGTVKVLDFGLAKAMEPTAAMSASLSMSPTITTPALTQTGIVLGTAAYMSPEQARGQALDKRTDIWSFGCVLYEMLAGKSPFTGQTTTDILAAVVKSEPDWGGRLDAVPSAIRSLLRRCLRKDPGERLHDIADARIEIKESVADRAAPALARMPASPSRTVSAQIIPWAAAALFAVALFVTQIMFRPKASPSLPVTRLELNMPAGVEVGSTNSPNLAISPDGMRLAFTGAVGGLRQLYVRKFDEFDVVGLGRGTETVNVCVFSPDGGALAFITSDRTLRKVSLPDGLVTTLAADADFTGGGLAWGTDDQITFGRAGALWQLSAGGGPERRLTTLDVSQDERAHASPFALPGGRAILFTTVTGGDRIATHIEALSVATGQRRRVTDGSYPLYATSGHVLFFRDGSVLAAPFNLETLEMTGAPVAVLDHVSLDQLGSPMMTLSSAGELAYVPSGNATKQLVWVSRQGVEEPITDTPRPYQNPRLAPDGHRIVVEVAGGDLWIEDTERSTFTRLTSKDTGGNTFAVWTPDAQRILFRTLTGIRWIEANGGAGSHAVPGTTEVGDIPTSISPDGHTLAFVKQSSTASADLYVLSLDGEPNIRPVVQTNGYDGGGQFSPDGHWMAYVSNESGQFEVYVRPYPGPDRKLQVSTRGGTHPKWNRNGKELFYRNGNQMLAVDVFTQPELRISQPHLLFEQRYAFGSAQSIPNYDVSPNGQRFLMVKDESSSGRLNIVLNWLEELKQRVRVK